MGKYLLLGYGISNKSIARFFDTIGIRYDIYDDFWESSSNIKTRFNIINYDCIIKSGSIKNSHKVMREAKENNIVIYSDLELFYKFSPKRELIAITGTNGKSTACKLTSLMLGYELVGNIGEPLFNHVCDSKPLVIEVSSYMSEYIDSFKAKIYGFLNLYPNHLDHHGSFYEYKISKFKMLKNIMKDDFIVYNSENNDFKEAVEKVNGIKVPFSVSNIQDGIIKVFGKEIIKIEELSEDLVNYLENVLLAVKIAMIKGVKIERIRDVLKSYSNLKHRMNLVCEYNNIKFYNDSKSTNLFALKNACKCFDGKRVLLICGGKDSPFDYDSLSSLNVSKIIVNGENRSHLNKCFSIFKKEVYEYVSLKEALINIHKYLDDIDIVLFSPGFQSFDQFNSFEERGEFYSNYIKSLFLTQNKV